MIIEESNPAEKKIDEKIHLIELFKETSNRISYSDDDANPDDDFLSCREAKEMISILAKNPYCYDTSEYRKIPFDCFVCKKTGGILTLRHLVKRGRLDIEDYLPANTEFKSEDERFAEFVKYVEDNTTCERKSQLETMKEVQRITKEKIAMDEEKNVSGVESILEVMEE